MSNTVTVVPYGYTETVSGQGEPVGSGENIYDGDPTTRGTLAARASASSTSTKTAAVNVFLELDFTSIPADASIVSVKLCVNGYCSHANASSAQQSGYRVSFTDAFQAFDGTSTSIGSATTATKGSSPVLDTYTLTGEDAATFVRSTDPRLRLRCYTSARKSTSSATSTNFGNTYYVYEAYVEVTYEISGLIVKTKVSGDWVDGVIKAKVDGEWVDATGLYVKSNGNWLQIGDSPSEE